MKETLREQFIKSALRDCRHFNGIQRNGIQRKVCKAGVTYQEGSATVAMPCVPSLIHNRTPWACDKFEIMSQAEAEVEADRRIEQSNKTLDSMRKAHEHAKSIGLKKGNGGKGSLPCPACGSGTIYYSVASLNGHMWAKCETAGCVSWME